MPSPFVTTITEPALGNAEYTANTPEAAAALEGCTAQALSKLSKSDKDLLKSSTESAKELVVQATDALVARRSRNNVQIAKLTEQSDQLKSDRNVVIQFQQVLQPVSDSCVSAAELSGSTKTLTNRLFTESVELDYRISIKQLLDGKIGLRIKDAENVVEKLDELLYLLSQ